MFELHQNLNGENVLVYTTNYRNTFERGLWVEICHENDREAKYFVKVNRSVGLQVEKDKKGFFRALVLRD